MSLIDEYRFDDGWKTLSEEQSEAGQPEPAVGQRVRLSDSREGTIEAVNKRGVLWRLTILLEDGAEKNSVYPSGQIQLLSDDGAD